MGIEKLQSFFRIKGVNKEGNKLIQREKRKYLWLRSLSLFTKKNYYSLGEGLTKPVIANSNGLFYCREKSLDLHIISDSYEFNVKKLFENLSKESKVIVDIGANIGRYTVLGGINSQAKIYSIEPEEDNFRILSKNVKLNNLNNIELFKIALGNKKGNAKLYKDCDSRNYGGHSLKIKRKDFDIVKLDTFDNLFKDKVKKIDLVKIDVEGFELDVLKGMKVFLSENKIKNIILEIDKENCSTIIALLKKYGYSVKHIMYNNYLARCN
ncbi:MAG: FkbM family methyltransferase [Candidatus Pacearchaeota archaeon]|nr:FkbM family methyltransferase [Candidatus Pacearchaeota archaeon]